MTSQRDPICPPTTSHVACRVLDSIADGVLVLDRNLELLFANAAAREVLGTGANDLGGADALSFVHPDDHREVRDGLQRCLQLVDEPVRHGFRIRMADDRIRRLEAVAVNRTGEEELNGIVVTLRDVTAQWKAEQALRDSESFNRKLVESAVDAIVTADTEGRLTGANAAACVLTGHTREELLKMHSYQLYVLEEQPLAQMAVEALARGEQMSVRRHLRRPDGTVLPVEVNARRIDDNGLHAIIRDVSAREDAAERAERSQRLESLGLLAASIGHDFGNLLTVVLSNACYVSAALPPGSPEAEAAEDLRAAAQRGVAMVRRLSRGLGMDHVELAQLELAGLARTVEHSARSVLPGTIRLEVDIETDLPRIFADAVAVDECALNVVINARDAMPLGGVLRISAFRAPVGRHTAEHHMWAASGDFVVLAFRDTGAGMDDATLRRVFEPYYTTKAGSGGTGLGMATVYRLMKQQLGFVNVESRIGIGTTVSLYFAVAAGTQTSCSNPLTGS